MRWVPQIVAGTYVAANPVGQAREGDVYIGGKSIVIQQSARYSTGCGVGIDALASPITLQAMKPPLITMS